MVCDIPKQKFEIIGPPEDESEKAPQRSMGYWADAWRRFKKNKVAVIALALLFILISLSTVGPLISGYSFEKLDAGNKNATPSWEHWFGTDNLGRDLFTRVCQAGRLSLAIGLFSALISTVAGTLYGSIAAFFGGMVDMVMMRVVEILTSIPHLIIVILISVYTDSKSFGTMILALTLTGWTGTARLIRGQILQLRSREFVLAAEALGVGWVHIITRHLIPNSLGLIIVGITFDIPGYIFAESFLSYIGLGIESPGTSWGALSAAAQANFRFYPFQLFYPSLMIALTMLSFTLLGDGLRDALDPRLRQ